MKTMLKFACILAFVPLSLALTGCVSPPSKSAMSINPGEQVARAPAHLARKFYVESVSGGKESTLFSPDIGNNGFQAALDLSLISTGYKAPDLSSTVYRINAQILKVDVPLGGIDMSVGSTVNYTITGAGVTTSTVVTAQGEAKFNEAFVGTDRMTMAVERAGKENISSFIKQLPQLIKQ